MRYVSPSKRKEVLERDGHRCVYCSVDLRIEPPHIDHKVPVSAGGSNDVDNLQATCSKCNARKKGFTNPDADIRKYLSRRQRIDEKETKVRAVVSPIIESMVWEDSESVSCPWGCEEVAKRVKDEGLDYSHSFVWRCRPCRKYFAVDGGYDRSDFIYSLDSVIWERDVAGMYGEVAKIVFSDYERRRHPDDQVSRGNLGRGYC